MSSKTAIVTDTNCGLRPEEAAELGIRVIPMPVILDGECFFEYDSISQAEFFEALKGGAEVSTSQPAPGAIQQCWDAVLEDHEELIYIPMSAGLSGECQTALGLAQDYGGRVWVADNRRISVTERQAALDALSLARQGRTAAEIQAFLDADGGNSDIFVAVNTLELLKKSGRVTAAGAALGAMLSIKPVLRIQGGKLDAYRKVRGMRCAMQAMIEGLQEDVQRLEGPLTVRAAYAGDLEAGQRWRDALQQAFPNCTVGLDPLPLSVCCHVGWGALGAGHCQRQYRGGGGTMKTAVVDVGGGMRGIYAAGVLDYCMDHEITFDLGIGVSAGSANISSFVAGQRGRNYPFYTDYPHRKEYMGLHELVHDHSYLNLDYVYGTLSNAGGENPLDFAAFQANPMEFMAVATNAETGEAVYLTKADMRQDDYSVLMASSAIPFVCHPYRVRGIDCYDGALSDTVPIQKAFDAGCEKVVLLLTKPLEVLRTSKTDNRLAKLIQKNYPVSAEQLRNRAERYNNGVALAKQYAAEGRLCIIAPDDTCGVDTLTKDRQASHRLYEKGYADGEKVRAFLTWR